MAFGYVGQNAFDGRWLFQKRKSPLAPTSFDKFKYKTMKRQAGRHIFFKEEAKVMSFFLKQTNM